MGVVTDVAKIIEYYIPESFRKKAGWIPSEQRGKVIGSVLRLKQQLDRARDTASKALGEAHHQYSTLRAKQTSLNSQIIRYKALYRSLYPEIEIPFRSASGIERKQILDIRVSHRPPVGPVSQRRKDFFCASRLIRGSR